VGAGPRVDERIVADLNLVTSRHPPDPRAYCRALPDQLAAERPGTPPRAQRA
jgi:hypothetical protein